MRQITVNIKPKEARIDKFLAGKIKTLTRSKIKQLINESHILVNNREVDPSYIVHKGDDIKIEIPAPKPLEVKAENIPLDIVYEDSELVVINKPDEMVIHPTVDHPGGTLVNALLHHFKTLPTLGETLRPGIVHRLDKGTSGLIVVAKNQFSLEDLKDQFKKREVVKKYFALVHGKLEPMVGTIDKPISRHTKNRKKFTVSEEGRPALTNYRVIKHLGNKYSLIEAEPKTGRTHQIRVHLSSIGHPILGDRLYGGKPYSRIFLHSSYLEFKHPKTGKRISFQSYLPSVLEKILVKLNRI